MPTTPDPVVDDADARLAAIAAGVLPDPTSPQWKVASSSGPDRDPLVALHERSLHNLSTEYRHMRSMLDTSYDEKNTIHHRSERRKEALLWLAQNYDLDALALEVIDHAVNGVV